jgi:Zn-finger nucleic acid-binding protein
MTAMKAGTLHCESCGAAVSTESPVCGHCGARLAVIACPTCFGMMSRGMKFCPHCGTAGAEWQSAGVEMRCPACDRPLLRGSVGETTLHECEKCFGLWLDTVTLERVCRDAERQAVLLDAASAARAGANLPLQRVRYLRCPVCHELMHRTNFAGSSGVVMDVCREHGHWFEINELQRIVQFIRAGGMDRARERQKAELAEERRRWERAQRERDRQDG